MTRAVLVLSLGLALVLAGCQRPVSGQPEPSSFADTLPLGLAQVREISGRDGLVRDVDTDRPVADGYIQDGPCRAVADQSRAYGEDWTAFRSVADAVDLDDGAAPGLQAVVAQHVVGYPEVAAARAVFERRFQEARACAELDIPGIGGTVTRLDDETAVWADDGLATVYAIKSAVLVDVSVVALPDEERIATDISRAILDRIP